MCFCREVLRRERDGTTWRLESLKVAVSFQVETSTTIVELSSAIISQLQCKYLSSDLLFHQILDDDSLSIHYESFMKAFCFVRQATIITEASFEKSRKISCDAGYESYINKTKTLSGACVVRESPLSAQNTWAIEWNRRKDGSRMNCQPVAWFDESLMPKDDECLYP